MATPNYAPQNGWVKVFYQLLEWEWYGDPNMVALFLHLLLRANFKTTRKKGVEFGRGVVLTSREQLAAETGISEQTVRTCLKRLKSTNEITIEATNQGSKITICNYDKYQGTAEESDQETNQQINHESTNDQPTANQQLTTCKEYKTVRSKEYYVVDLLTREEFLKNFFREENTATLEAICMSEYTTLENLKKFAAAVLDEWQATDVPTHRDISEAKRHLLSQIRIKLSVERREQAAAEKKQVLKPAAANRQQDKAPRRVNDQWQDFKLPTE